MTKPVWLAAALVASFGLATAGAATPTLRLADTTDVDTLDPALAFQDVSWSLLSLTCRTLMDLPGRATRGSPGIAPGAAADFPRVSADGRTYTFVIRRDLRFSDGAPIRAANYARALGRIRNPAMQSPIAFLADDIESARASGYTLRVRLRQAHGDFVSRAALPFTCPVPLNFPIDPAGVDLPVGSGAYFVARRTVGREIVLRPNPYYRGAPAPRFTEIDFAVTGTPESLIQDTDAGRIDYAFGDTVGFQTPAATAELVKEYGIGKGRLFYKHQLDSAYVAFNLRRGVFSTDVRLRRAVNFAVDRPEIIRQRGSAFSDNRTDQILPATSAFFHNVDLYPLKGANVQAARRLAGDRLHGRTIVLYSALGTLRQSNVIAYNLRRLGADVVVKAFARPVLTVKLNTPGEPWDIAAMMFWIADNPDPYDFLGPLFVDPPGLESNNFTGFRDPRMIERIRRADRLTGAARYQALAALENELMRVQVPVAPISTNTGLAFVSPRLSCVTFDAMGGIDFRRVCLRN